MQRLAYAHDDHGREIEQALILTLLRADDDTRWTRAELVRQLSGHDPEQIAEALARLSARGVVQIDAETIEAIDSVQQRQRLDQLSAVVVHLLVLAHPAKLTLAEVAKDCERDLSNPAEREEVELALRWIEGDELAVRQDDGWLATRPAVRSAELSF